MSRIIYVSVTLILVLCCVMAILGCGGGGGGGGSFVSANTTQNTTISGNIVLPSEINNALLGSVKANTAIDYTKLKVEIASAGQTIKSVSVQSNGTYQITVEQVLKSHFELYVLNPSNNKLMACLLEDVEPGKFISNVTINDESTAILAIINEYNKDKPIENHLRTKDVKAQIAKINQVITALRNFYKNQTSGSPLFDNSIRNEINNIKSQLIPGISQIIASYNKIKQELEDNNLDVQTRLYKFMNYISLNFKDLNGNNAYDELRNLTEGRLDRYIINEYKFDPMSFEYVNQNQIKVVTNMFIKVTRKPGKEGGFAQAEVPLQNKDVYWEYDSNQNKWLIIKGLPYKQGEINI